MDEIVLINALERYLAEEMTDQERVVFEELRKSNLEIDQMAVEHTFFLNELSRYGTVKKLRHTLNEVEVKLTEEGIIAEPQIKGKARIVYLWNKYKKTVAVAASIAIVISLSSTGLIFTYAKKYGNESYQKLVSKINQTDQEIYKLKQFNSSSVKTEPKIDYRATGFLIDGKGFLVTNAHVISKMKNIYVANNKGDYFTASPVFSDKNTDLAIIKINDSAFRPIANFPYSINKTNADLGEEFFTLGFPRNEIVYGEGYVSANSGNEGDSAAYQLTVSANPGNSGAPVINKNGEVIAIITAKDTKADGVVYASKSKYIFKILDQLKKTDPQQYQNLKTPAATSLKGIDRVKQVKKMEDFVFKVLGN